MDVGRAERKGTIAPGRLLPLAILVAAVVAVFALGLDRYISLETLARHREWLLAQVQGWYAGAALAFILVYAASVALSVPGAWILTLAAGFLFGTPVGAAFSVIGATIGATLLFLIARTALGETLRARAGPFLRKLEAGFRENAFNYLLVLRLIPLFPFWLVNLVPALLGVSLSVFVLATFLGIIPGSLVYAGIGSGLGSIFERGDQLDPRTVLMDPQVWLPLVGLAVLALIPVAYKKLRRGPAARRGVP
jgi:uncharacterized membrane protein YdjX (TVP38/TMEM64 family)